MVTVLKIGNRMYQTTFSSIRDVVQYFKPNDGVLVLDTVKLKDAKVKTISMELAKALNEESGVIERAIQELLLQEKRKEEEDLKNKLKKLLSAGVFAVAPTTQTNGTAEKLFAKRGGLYYLNTSKLLEEVIKKKIARNEDIVALVKRVMDLSGLKYYDFHISWLNTHAKEIYERAVKEREYRQTLVLVDTGKDIELVFGRKLSPEELVILKNTFTTVYYTQDSRGELTRHKMTVLKYDKVRKRYRIPYFAVPHLMKVAKKLKIRKIVNRVNWVKRKIPESKKVDIRLYKFQAKALNAWVDAGFRGTVVIPTGGGKTYIGLVAIGYLSVPTLICVTTIELARQWVQKIKEHLGIEAGLFGGGKHEIKDVTVAIYNSAVKHIDELKDHFDLFISDESHHIPSKVLKEIAFKLKARKRLALSATPYRIDKNEALLFFTMGDIVYKAKYKDMVNLKLAAPLRYYRFYVKLTPDERTKYAQVSSLPNTSPTKVLKMMQVAFMAKRKYEVLRKIVQKLPGDRILIFCQYVEQAKEAYSVLKDFLDGQVALFIGSTKSDLRKKYFELFKSGKLRVIVTTTVLDEGIDVPDAETAIILSGSGTKRQMIQRIGRVIRYRPKKVAKVIEIVTKDTIEAKLADRRVSVLREYDLTQPQ